MPRPFFSDGPPAAGGRRRAREEEDDDGPTLGGTIAGHKFRDASRARASAPPRHARAAAREELDSDDAEDDGGENGDEGDEDGGGAAASSRPVAKDRNAPQEMKSNRPVSRLRHVVVVPKAERRDPRFEASSGSFDDALFSKAYSFLDGYRDDEIKALGGELKKVSDPEEREQLRAVLVKLRQTRANVQQQRTEAAVVQETKRVRREAVAEGKGAYFPKKRDLREMVAVQRFKELERKGGGALEKALAKKRKKLVAKDRKRAGSVLAGPPPTRRGMDGGAAGGAAGGAGGPDPRFR
jgi:ribosomal RNA-processing protein 36